MSSESSAAPFWPDYAARCPEFAAALAAASPPLPPAGDAPFVQRTVAEAYVGPYALLLPVGEGGVAAVWRARHVHPAFQDRPTAVKLLHAAHTTDARLLQLFRREADVLSLIRHDNVVQTYEAGHDAGRMYLGMEYVPGCDLAHFLWRAGKQQVALPVRLLVHVAREVLLGLSYAHNLKDLHERPLGLVHRDVNPSNVLLSFTGAVKLSDFGVASVHLGGGRRAEELAGKAGYFAPEQLAGQAATPDGDIYALAVTLYEMLAGRALFVGDDMDAVLAHNRRGTLPAAEAFLPNVAAGLTQVVRQALQPTPKGRPASAAAFAAALLPYAPEPRAARLLLSALMRQLFDREYVRERRLMRRLRHLPPLAAAALVAPPPPSPTADVRAGGGSLPVAVDVVVAEPIAAGALVEVLQGKGWEVAHFASLAAWCSARSGLHPPAPVAIVDTALEQVAPTVPSEAQLAAERAAALRAHRTAAQRMRLEVRHLQVFALGNQFDLAAAECALLWQARELWVPPFAIERVTAGVRAGYKAALAAADGAAVARPQGASSNQAVLLVGQDRPWLAAAQSEAQRRGDAWREVTSLAEASALADHTSFDFLVVPAQAAAAPAELEHLQRFRGSWGMGDVPCLFSGPAAAAGNPLPALPPRCAWHTGGPWDGALASAYAHALPGQVRAFARYDVALRVAVRLGGQVWEARTVNVSRRGLLLEILQLPSVGTQVMLSLYLPNQDVVQVRGKALRVVMAQAPTGRDAPQDGPTPARLGMALGPFLRADEQVWLRWLKGLASEAAAAERAGARPLGWQRLTTFLGRAQGKT